MVMASGLIALSGCTDNTQRSATPEATRLAGPAQSSASADGTRIKVTSHCGVLSVTLTGHLWLADPPLGHHNPPDGWDENETSGVFVMVGPGRGEFHGDGGKEPPSDGLLSGLRTRTRGASSGSPCDENRPLMPPSAERSAHLPEATRLTVPLGVRPQVTRIPGLKDGPRSIPMPEGA